MEGLELEFAPMREAPVQSPKKVLLKIFSESTRAHYPPLFTFAECFHVFRNLATQNPPMATLHMEGSLQPHR